MQTINYVNLFGNYFQLYVFQLYTLPLIFSFSYIYLKYVIWKLSFMEEDNLCRVKELENYTFKKLLSCLWVGSYTL